MQLGRHLRELWGLKLGLVISVLLAAAVAVTSVYSIELLPPKLTPRELDIGSASTSALIDSPRSLVVDLAASSTDLEGITNRALLIGNVMASNPARNHIARAAGIPPEVLRISAPTTRRWPRQLNQSGIDPAATDLLRSPREYRLSVTANPTVPIVNVFAAAPSAVEARRLADAAIMGTRAYLASVAEAQGVPAGRRVRIEQLSRARGEVIDRGVGTTVAVLTFLIAFGISCLTVLFIARVRRGWHAQAMLEG